MGRRQAPARRDGTQQEVVDTFIALGCSVVDMAACGVPDFPDLVVGVIGITHLVEVKDQSTRYGRAGLSEGQSRFARDWRGSKVWLCHNALEAQALVQNWRRR